MALLDDVISFLTDEALVDDSGGWEAFKSFLPEDPDRAVAVFETPGTAPTLEKLGSAGAEYDDVGFQVRIRGSGPDDYPETRARMGEIYRALHGSQLSPATGDPTYLWVHASQSGPFPLGLDSSSRPGLTWNFTARRQRETP